MLETPITSAPIVVNYLSSLPANRIGITSLQRGVEIGLAHGFFIPGPFIKLGPLRRALNDNRVRIIGLCEQTIMIRRLHAFFTRIKGCRRYS